MAARAAARARRQLVAIGRGAGGSYELSYTRPEMGGARTLVAYRHSHRAAHWQSDRASFHAAGGTCGGGPSRLVADSHRAFSELADRRAGTLLYALCAAACACGTGARRSQHAALRDRAFRQYRLRPSLRGLGARAPFNPAPLACDAQRHPSRIVVPFALGRCGLLALRCPR